MMSARRSLGVIGSRRRWSPRPRRGVLLLVVLALLALLTLLGLTLVVATSQGRMSALAAARANASAVRDDSAADEVLNQVLRGTNDPDSSLQGHSLLEDLYGPPQLYGRVMPTSAASPAVVQLAGGQLLNINIAASPGYALAPYSGAYCGQVITVIDGPAQGYSSRIVGYLYNPASPTIATIQVLPFSGLIPNPAVGTYLGDQFVVNGRPFSGTGFGFDLTHSTDPTSGAPNLDMTWNPPKTLVAPDYPTYLVKAGTPLLSALESTSAMPNKPAATGMPYAYYAYLPNHAQIQLTQPVSTSPPNYAAPPYYFDVTGPGGANESYDAVDFQNMMLAMHIQYGSGNAVTPIPSLHRPELIAWFAQQNYLLSSSSAVPVNIRRKAVLRPEPTDQVFIPASQDLNGNGVWDFREPFVDMDGNGFYSVGDHFLDLNGDSVWTPGDLDYSGNQFNPITGCWYINGSAVPPVWVKDNSAIGGLDIDNDNDGIPDSIWVDVGLPVQTLADGTQYKSLAAILCIDMDGKINLNAHGTIAQLDPNRYFNTAGGLSVPAPFAGNATGQVAAESAAGVRNLVFGQGYGPPEVNPAYLLSRATGGGGTVNAATLNYYAYLMMGYAYYDYSTTPPTFRYSVDGKYGESARVYLNSTYLGLFPPSNDNSPYPTPNVVTPGYNFSYYLLGGPRPGWSRWIDPWMTSLTSTNAVLDPSLTGWDWVNDPMTLTRFSDYRPYLLTPFNQLQGVNSQQGVFFDFIGAGLTPTTGAPAALPVAGSGAAPPWYSAFSAAASPSVHLPTAHGSPYDLLARGVVATDLRGVPYYAGTTALPWMAGSAAFGATDPTLPIAATVPVAPSGGNILYDASINALNDAVDSAYELDLSPNAQHAGRITGNYGGTGAAPSDAPIAPTELEGVLRVYDPDAVDLRKRLDQLETVYANDAAPKYPLVPSGAPLSASSLTNVRLSLTSESWDLPVPSVALTPQQMQDVAYFNTLFSTATPPATLLVNGPVTGFPQLDLNGLSLTDLARARIFNENAGNPAYLTPNSADLALFGNVNTNPTAAASGAGVWPLLAPEVIMGLRLDINRLLGNGHDDNGNGVVDEPLEAVQLIGGGVTTEAMTYPWSPINSLPNTNGSKNPLTGMNNTLQWLDLNNDGLLPMVGSATPLASDPQLGTLVPTYGDLSLADMRARQLLARQLYVTMMLLLDDRSIYANIYQTSGAALPWNALPANSPQQAAYVVAQWAINAVDFRDRDAIMTPFEFDIYPFGDNDGNPANGTWDVDDLLTGAGDDLNTVYRGIVWGCERPELLMTEAVAFHDRGTDDTNQAQNVSASNPDTYVNQGMVPDTDYDQVRRPRGSLVIELFNSTSWSDPPQRDLQYDQSLGSQPWQIPIYAQPWMNTNYPVANQGYGVNLAQVAHVPPTAPPLPPSPAASPVWRLAIAYSPLGYDTHLSAAATSYTLDPRAPQLPSTKISRAVYFTPYQAAFSSVPGTINEISASQSFFADADVVPLSTFLMVPPGQYAVVGPASPVNATNQPATSTAAVFSNSIFIGQNYSSSGATGRVSPAANSYPEQLELGGGGGWTGPVGMYSGGTALAPYNKTVPPFSTTDIKPVIGVPIQTNWLDAFGNYIPHLSTSINSPPANLQTTLRMSISEPLTGYPVFGGVVADDGFYYSGQGTPTGGQFPTHPFDSGNSTTPALTSSPNPYVIDGTTNAYTIVFLQRLANPLIPWNQYSNPYITVDSMPVDLTGYTGENHPLDPASTTTAEPTSGYKNFPASGVGALALNTRRRGEQRVTGTANPEAPNVWGPVLWTPNAQTTGTLAAPLPSHTLGYLNSEYGTYYSSTNSGNLATISTNTGIPASLYYGDPLSPFPWLPWLDRPYVSQYELMLVPASSPASLYSDFAMLGWQSNYTGTSINEYLGGQPAAAGQLPVAQFRQLLNFYDSQHAPPPAAVGTNTYLPDMYRIFEHVHVPSRFAGTQTMLNPFQFEPLNPASGVGALPHAFHPPFNWASNYREPGKMNLNTMFDPQGFQGMMDSYPGWLTLWQQVIDSRQGFNGFGNSIVPDWQLLWTPDGSGIARNAVLPTFFANPFRPDGAGALVPFGSMTNSGLPLPVTSQTSLMHFWNHPNATAPFNIYNGVNATMLRARSTYANPGQVLNPVTTTSLFDDGTFDPFNINTQPANVPYNALTTPPANFQLTTTNGGGSTAYRNAGRSPYFQYQALQRLGNLATNRSNVYGIWITLGKFEVQRVPISATNPDGYALYQELGSSNGEIERKRAFYLIDRSIPVGFSRGENLNVERTVLVERILDD